MPHAKSALVVVGRSGAVVDHRESGNASSMALASERACHAFDDCLIAEGGRYIGSGSDHDSRRAKSDEGCTELVPTIHSHAW